MYRKHFATQLTLNLERSIFTDALFCAVYLKLTAESPLEEIPAIHESVDPMKGFIEAELARVFEARSTADIVSFVNGLMEGFEEVLEKDMLNTYFFFRNLTTNKLTKKRSFKI